MQESTTDIIHSFYREYYRAMMHYGIKLVRNEELVKDCIQDCFFGLWQNPSRLARIENPKNYLIGTLRNLLLKQLSVKQHDTDSSTLESFDVSVEDNIIEQENIAIRSDKLQEAIDTLTPKQKEILYLRFYEGFSYDEIEKITGTNYQSVRNLLSKTLKKLKQAVLFVFWVLFCSRLDNRVLS